MPLAGSSTLGETLTLMLDTGMGAPGRLDLGGCGIGNPAPQVVIEYTVPGTGPAKVELNTLLPGTSMETDTLLSIRTEACEVPEPGYYPALCFDDFEGDLRSRGTLALDGGDTIWIVVSTYSADDAGPIQLDITATANAAPVIEEAFVTLVGDAIEVEVRGSDEDGNATGVWVSLLDDTRGLVDIDDDGLSSLNDAAIALFDTPVTGATAFTETSTIDVANVTRAVDAHVRIIDDANAVSEPLVVPVETGTRVGFGEMCDGMMTICPRELVCTMGTCQPTPALAAACAAAPGITVAPGMPGSVMGVLMPGTGSFRGSCGATFGTELFYTVDVPAMGAWDLVLTTIAPGTADGADTVLYVRAQCTDPGSAMELWCNDDDIGLLSTVEVLEAPGGTYTAFVESYAGVEMGMTMRFELVASLRQVLDAGAACDPELILNRCRMGDCPATAVCP